MADLLDSYARTLLAIGRLDTLAMYIDSLPPETLHEHPALCAARIPNRERATLAPFYFAH
jgi:ATP/maltotriose-dependent transcriptional regulator MalT